MGERPTFPRFVLGRGEKPASSFRQFRGARRATPTSFDDGAPLWHSKRLPARDREAIRVNCGGFRRIGNICRRGVPNIAACLTYVVVVCVEPHLSVISLPRFRVRAT